MERKIKTINITKYNLDERPQKLLKSGEPRLSENKTVRISLSQYEYGNKIFHEKIEIFLSFSPNEIKINEGVVFIKKLTIKKCKKIQFGYNGKNISISQLYKTRDFSQKKYRLSNIVIILVANIRDEYAHKNV